MRDPTRRLPEYVPILTLKFHSRLKSTIMTDHGDPGSFQLLDHPSPVSNWPCSGLRRRPNTRLLCCVQTRLYRFPIHWENFDSTSKGNICNTRCTPKSRFGPIWIRDGNVCLEFPFLTGLFDDLAQVFFVVPIVLSQSLLGVQGSLSDLVKVRIGRVNQHI